MNQYDDEIQLKDILIKLSEYKVYLLKKKITILSISFLCLVVGVLFAMQTKTKYNAELTFVVEGEKGEVR